MARPSVVERLHAKQSSSSSPKGKLRTLSAKLEDLEDMKTWNLVGHSDSDVALGFDLPLTSLDTFYQILSLS